MVAHHAAVGRHNPSVGMIARDERFATWLLGLALFFCRRGYRPRPQLCIPASELGITKIPSSSVCCPCAVLVVKDRDIVEYCGKGYSLKIPSVHSTVSASPDTKGGYLSIYHMSGLHERAVAFPCAFGVRFRAGHVTHFDFLSPVCGGGWIYSNTFF